MKNFFIITAAAMLPLLSSPAGAELNVPVAGRVVSFLQPAVVGAVPAVIIYQPGNAASEAEASAIEQAIGQGLAVGRASIRVRRLAVGNLAGLAGQRVAFVTTGLRSRYAEIAAAAAHASILTITSDLNCVTAGACVVGVADGSRVQITVSRAASRADNIHFGSAFLMLVKEI